MTSTVTKPGRLLIASVVLNVFLVGAMVGGAYRWSTTRSAPPVAAAAATASNPRGLRAATAELPADRRTQLRDALQHMRRANRPLILDARAGRRDVVAALKAQPFDQAALDAALGRARAADAALRAQIERTIGDFAAGLSNEERAKLVEAMEGAGQSRRDGGSND